MLFDPVSLYDYSNIQMESNLHRHLHRGHREHRVRVVVDGVKAGLESDDRLEVAIEPPVLLVSLNE